MGLDVTVSTAAGTITLADDNDLARSNLRINGQRLVDEVHGFRADWVQLFDRGNRKTVISFDVKRVFESSFDAIVTALDHNTKVPIIGLIELTISEGGQLARRWLQNASIMAVDIPRQRGAALWFTYQITGGEVLTTHPLT